MDAPVFVVGDVHGHLDRLEALLRKAKVEDQECVVVQLGDLGHFGSHTMDGDRDTWEFAQNGGVDIVLWGNHDRAAVDEWHEFGGFAKPISDATTIMNEMERDERLLMAYAAHGWLITHAGLHAQFKYTKVPDDVDRSDAASIAGWLNSPEARQTHQPDRGFTRKGTSTIPSNVAVVNAIGRTRGGGSHYGGILWRDITEKLWRKVPQVFGHSASRFHIVRGDADKWYCIDIGGRGGTRDLDANCLAGIWLPSQEIVRIDMYKDEDAQYL